MAYIKWKKYLHSSIELNPIELAGRGKRFAEPLSSCIDESINDIYMNISNDIEETEYAIFGHSMGSLLAYELTHKIMELGNREPIHLFVSGRYPPFIKGDEKIIHLLPDDEFKEELFKIGGTPKEFFEYKELMAIYIPILRADYKLVEKYVYTPKKNKLNCDITAFFSNKDEDVNLENMSMWALGTSKNCRVLEFEGDHFFINHKSREIIDVINKTLINKNQECYTQSTFG